MASRKSVERQRAAQRGVVSLARNDLQAFWSALDLTKPELARNALLEFMPQVVNKYGEIAESVAADFFEELADEAGRPASATLADTVASEAVEGQVRYAARHLFTDSPQSALSVLSLALQKDVLAPARNTLIRSASASGAAWARVPSGATTCAFCMMLASRGFVYGSDATAGKRVKFHGDCDCQIVPDWSDDPALEGYDPDGLYARYRAARDAAETTSTSSILAAARDMYGLS